MDERLRITILGLSITSSWGNGHATNYRGVVDQLLGRGHDVQFLERDRYWYAQNRDMTGPLWDHTHVYQSLEELRERFAERVRTSDVVVVGSYVPDGVEVGRWAVNRTEGVTAFYDIDTPVTLTKLRKRDYEYLSPDLIPDFDLYLSFAGGATLELLRDRYGSPRPRPFYCCVDPDEYWPEEREIEWDLGYLGTYSADRQPPLERLMLAPARRWRDGRFAVVGPQYPESLRWPRNVDRVQHLAPGEHRAFYCAQRFTMNVTRADMIRAGHAPSVRLFEAAGCGTPIISDYWRGLEDFFELGTEILISRSSQETLRYLQKMPAEERIEVGRRARRRVLSAHTAEHRAVELEEYVREAREGRARTAGAAHSAARGAREVEAGFCGGSAVAAGSGRARREEEGASREIRSAIRELGPWFHNVHLGAGLETAPDHPFGDFPRVKWETFSSRLPADMEGWTALDLGCNAGFYAFELARRGAQVLGIDSREQYLRQARWAAGQLALEDRVEFQRMQIYELARMERTFDLVLFMGVLYHLRYPMLALDLVARKVRRSMIFQTLTMPGEEVRSDTRVPRINEREALTDPAWPSMAFVEEELAGDPTNWWVPNHAGVLAMLRSCGMRVVERPAHEIYLCEPDPAVRKVPPDEEEVRAATGTLEGP